MLAEKSEVTIQDVLEIIQLEVAKLARCAPEEVGVGDVRDVGLGSRPMLVVVAYVERRLGYDKLLKREDIKPEIVTNITALALRLVERVKERED